MKTWNWITRLLIASAAALASAAAAATPVTLTLLGHVSGYEFIDLSTVGIANNSAVNLSLTFNETWSDGSYSFSDVLGPVSGSMSVGSHNFIFNAGNGYSYSSGGGGGLNWVEPKFLGTGPTLGGGDFFGLFATFTPTLALQGEMYLGYGFTTAYPDGISITSYGYAKIAADSYTITDATVVPEPATLSLAMTGLLAAGFARRRMKNR